MLNQLHSRHPTLLLYTAHKSRQPHYDTAHSVSALNIAGLYGLSYNISSRHSQIVSSIRYDTHTACLQHLTNAPPPSTARNTKPHASLHEDFLPAFFAAVRARVICFFHP